jgi:hypothetical protein
VLWQPLPKVSDDLLELICPDPFMLQRAEPVAAALRSAFPLVLQPAPERHSRSKRTWVDGKSEDAAAAEALAAKRAQLDGAAAAGGALQKIRDAQVTRVGTAHAIEDFRAMLSVQVSE